jgi:hypothetical protein
MILTCISSTNPIYERFSLWFLRLGSAYVVQPFALTHSRYSPPTAVCCYANAKVHVKTDKDAESRIPSFNPTSDLFFKPRLNRDVCMIHQCIRKPKRELISIDQPGALTKQPHLRLEYLQPLYSNKDFERDFYNPKPPTKKTRIHLQQTWHPTPTSTCTQLVVRLCPDFIIVASCSSNDWF